MRHASYAVFLVFCMLAVSVGVRAEDRVVPDNKAQVLLSFAPVVKRVAPAVVNIYTRKLVKQRSFSPFMNDPLFQQFFGGDLSPGLTRQRLENSLGSGVIVSRDGLIITNNHVTADADQIVVVLHDRREYEAKIITADEHSDLSVLRIEAKEKNLPFLELADSDTAEVGDMVLAIGNPFGVGQTVTSGIISAMARTAVDINDLNYFIQTDAAINPGNSGGALVDMNGKLIGINSAIFSRSGGNMGIGFAIPSNMVSVVLKAVSEGRRSIVRPWVGLNGQEVTSALAESLGMSQPAGVLINYVNDSSPAKRGGLKIGDVITEVNRKPVEDPDAFRFRVATLPIGSKAYLKVLRSGQQIEIEMDLIAPPEIPARDKSLIEGNNPLSGATVVNVSPAVIEEMRLRDVDGGVVIEKINGGVAARIGIRPGDIIAFINGKKVDSVKTLKGLLQSRFPKWQLSIRRDGNILTIVVGG